MKRKHYKFINTTNKLEINFDNVNFVMNQIDFGFIEASINSYAGAGQYGQTITSRTLAEREIEISGYIMANDKSIMQKLKHRLQTVTSPLNDFQIVVDEQFVLTVTSMNSVYFAPEFYQNNEQLAYFELECMAANPFFQLKENIDGEIASWEKDIHLPITFRENERFTVGHRNPALIAKIENKGEVESGIVIKMKAISGNVINPYITNIDTNETIKLNATINNNEEILINTEYGNKEIRNITTDENWLNYLDLSSKFMVVPVGISNFTYGFDEGSIGTLRCTIEYMPKFMAV